MLEKASVFSKLLLTEGKVHIAKKQLFFNVGLLIFTFFPTTCGTLGSKKKKNSDRSSGKRKRALSEDQGEPTSVRWVLSVSVVLFCVCGECRVT